MALPVVLKGGKKYMTLVLTPDLDFEELLTLIIAKFKETEKFFGNQPIALSLEGRELSEREKLLIMDAIGEFTTVQISVLLENDRFREIAAEKAAGEILHPREQAEEDSAALAAKAGLNCQMICRDIEAGEKIRCIGSLLVKGNVAKGAYITAGGSVTVWGTLSGSVYAGTDESLQNSFIAALDFQPERFTIASAEGHLDKKHLFGRKKPVGRVAEMKDGVICITTLN